jgi:hypothetical protein
MNTVKLLKLAGALAVALAAVAPSASVAYPAAPHQMQTNERFAMDDRMPPDRIEHVPPMPHRGFVWHKGHWRFDRGAWVWVSGLWRAR